jgi:hypothetical protein
VLISVQLAGGVGVLDGAVGLSDPEAQAHVKAAMVRPEKNAGSGRQGREPAVRLG